MTQPLPYFGELLSLTTAIVWSIAVIFFKKSGESVAPLALNLFKNTLAAVLFFPTMLIFQVPFVRDVPFSDYWMLLISGALGIGIADTMFFRSLNLLGASRSAIVDCLYSPFIIFLSVLWLDERLVWLQFAGVALIVTAILLVTFERNHSVIPRRQLIQGISWGVLSQAAMAVGIVMVKPILNRSPVLWAIEVRLIGGALVLLLLLALYSKRREALLTLTKTRSWGYVLIGSFTGAYVALLFWVAGMKYTQASISSALNQTSNIFIFIFAALFLKERITPLRLAGIILAVGGVYLVAFG